MASKATHPPDIASRTLLDLLRNIAQSGRNAIENPSVSDADAVHDLRKALKAWRAMMRLVAHTVGDEADAMRLEARDVARTVATARDSLAAQDALADLSGDAEEKLRGVPARTRSAIEDRLSALQASAEAVTLSTERRTRISAMWRQAGAVIERWPLDRFDRFEAARQLTVSYRRVRKATPVDWTEAHPEALHKLRQRVVDHRHQLEIAEPVWPKLMRLWVSEAQRLRDRLGAHHDLEILRHFTEPDQPLSRWRSQLGPLIESRQEAHAKSARRLTGRLFAETPQAFHDRLAALWERCA